MSYNPHFHHRRSIRLKGYDYSGTGLYFITICLKDMACLFGKFVGAPLVGAQNVGAQKTGAQKTDAHEKGQPQGIAPTTAAPVRASIVGAQNTAQLILNDAGKMVESEWLKLPERFPNIVLHEYIVMPNHFHAILEIVPATNPDAVGATLVVAQNVVAQNTVDVQNNVAQNTVDAVGAPLVVAQNVVAQNTVAPTKTVGDMVGAFQSIVTVNYIHGVKTLNWTPFNGKLWHRNYWEHIIRDEQSYQTISDYIINNPSNWANDKFFKK
jgi:putative transposase